MGDPTFRRRYLDHRAGRLLTPARRVIDELTIISTEQLTRDTIELAGELPSDIDGIAAAARSGLLPGSLLAAWLHLPLWSVSRACGVVDVGHGFRMGETFQPAVASAVKHLLVIDDTAATGKEMPACVERARAGFPGVKITRAVIYCHPRALAEVDLCHSVYPGSHYLLWNFPNAGHSQACAYDWDGILCAECPAQDDDDGPRYRQFLATAKPLYLPRRRPVPLVCSARHDRYREQCMAWLDRHGVTVRELMLRDWDYDPARSHDDQVGEWKAACYGLSACTLFAESSPAQAQTISERTGKRVLCPALGRVLAPVVTAPIKRGCCK